MQLFELSHCFSCMISISERISCSNVAYFSFFIRNFYGAVPAAHPYFHQRTSCLYAGIGCKRRGRIIRHRTVRFSLFCDFNGIHPFSLPVWRSRFPPLLAGVTTIAPPSPRSVESEPESPSSRVCISPSRHCRDPRR